MRVWGLVCPACTDSCTYSVSEEVFLPLPTGTKFRVHLKETDSSSLSGPVDLVINEEALSISLHSVQTGV